MDFIDEEEHIAVGGLVDAELVAKLKEERIDLVVDAREFFRAKPRHFRLWPPGRDFFGLLAPLEYEPIVKRLQWEGSLLVHISNYGRTRVLIHCTFGVDRTPFLAAVYLSRKNNIKLRDAYLVVKSKHPQTKLHWDWVEILEGAIGMDGKV